MAFFISHCIASVLYFDPEVFCCHCWHLACERFLSSGAERLAFRRLSELWPYSSDS